LARDLGVNISGIAIILQMRERMDQMQKEMQEFMRTLQKEMMSRIAQPSPSQGAIVPIRRVPVPPNNRDRK